MSLVADYGSDSENSDVSDGDNEERFIKTEIKQEPQVKAEEDQSSDESDSNVKDTKLPLLALNKLPVPTFNVANSQSGSGLVFTNPFLDEEHAKEAILEKHVKMINAKNVAVINGKKICWNYRKGRCRFGHNCKFAHDSDLQKSKEQLNAELEVAQARSVVCQSESLSGTVNFSGAVHPTETQEIESEGVLEATSDHVIHKRKRPGLTQGLVPGKRVMKQYLSNKS